MRAATPSLRSLRHSPASRTRAVSEMREGLDASCVKKSGAISAGHDLERDANTFGAFHPAGQCACRSRRRAARLARVPPGRERPETFPMTSHRRLVRRIDTRGRTVRVVSFRRAYRCAIERREFRRLLHAARALLDLSAPVQEELRGRDRAPRWRHAARVPAAPWPFTVVPTGLGLRSAHGSDPSAARRTTHSETAVF